MTCGLPLSPLGVGGCGSFKWRNYVSHSKLIRYGDERRYLYDEIGLAINV